MDHLTRLRPYAWIHGPANDGGPGTCRACRSLTRQEQLVLTSPDVGLLKEVVMPLSEHEQKLLELLEKQLHEDDPKFANSIGSDP